MYEFYVELAHFVFLPMFVWFVGQLRTKMDRDNEKGCQKPAVRQKTTDDVHLFSQQKAT